MKKNAAGNILAAFLSACVLCGAARASGGENTLSISPSFVSVHRGDSNGFTGAQLKYRRGIDDFYNFFFSGTFARTLDEDAADKNTFFLNA
ncbi:MAG: hypothetical protein FJ088_17165, partial [Deltaproteobacteria bacterium]|nr:hypothetical protein [Deltaproteobacteria bacterium]